MDRFFFLLIRSTRHQRSSDSYDANNVRVYLFLSRLAQSLKSSSMCSLSLSLVRSLVMHARIIGARTGEFFLRVLFLLNFSALNDEVLVVIYFSVLVFDR